MSHKIEAYVDAWRRNDTEISIEMSEVSQSEYKMII